MPQVNPDSVRKIVESAVILKKTNRALTATDLTTIINQQLNPDFLKHIRDLDYGMENQDELLSVSFAYFDGKKNKFLTATAGYQHPLFDDQLVNDHTLYNIASISKFVLTIMMFRLIQANKISLTSPINAHFHALKGILPITIADLLAHRSGLRDAAFMNYEAHQPISDLMKYGANNNPLSVQPGSEFYYANINFVLIGHMLQVILNQSLSRSLEELIKKPLGLTGIDVIDPKHMNDQAYAHGYAPDEVHTQLSDASNHFIYAATGFRANPKSLSQLIYQVFNSDFITPALKNILLQSIKSETFELVTPNNIYRWPANVGMGIEARKVKINEDETITLYGHGGWQNSHASFLGYDPTEQIAYCCCVTKTHGLANIHQNRISNQLKTDATLLPPMGFGCVDLRLNNNDIIDAAIQKGVTHFDTAECYGNNESERALGEKIKNYPREKLFIASKCGVTFQADGMHLSGKPDYIKAACEATLTRLQTDYLDLYYLHRVAPDTPLEESVAALAELVNAGKIKRIGLSEVTADQLKRAHRIHPISAVQIEYAPWSRDDEKNGLLVACRALKVNIVAYSPLGRAFFTSEDPEFFKNLPQSDYRTLLPRYVGTNLANNLASREKLIAIAEKKHCSLAQLVLAWEINKGMTVIPGTTKLSHLDENLTALLVQLSTKDMQAIDAILKTEKFAGPRYPSSQFSGIYPETKKKSTSEKFMQGVSFAVMGGIFAYQAYKEATKKLDGKIHRSANRLS